MKFKDALCGGLFYAIALGGLVVVSGAMGASAYRVGRDDAEEKVEVVQDETNESEKEES